MSFSNPNVELTYNGNGSDDIFGVNFTYLEGETSSIAVELWDYTDPDVPVQQSFVLNVDYTIDESGYPATNIVTTDPVPVNFKLFIYRNTPKLQPASFVNGAFPAESVEEAIDRVAFIGQENSAKLGRAILNPIDGPQLDSIDLLNYEPRIAQNESDITQLQTDVATNAGNIGTNNSSIASLSAQVGTNTSQIGTNTAQIALNTQAILALSPPIITVLNTASQVYNASTGDILIVKANDVTINLPACVANCTVLVKMDGLKTNTTINSPDGIDGFGSSYTLLSFYESLSLVSDGTQWYII